MNAFCKEYKIRAKSIVLQELRHNHQESLLQCRLMAVIHQEEKHAENIH